MTLKLRAIPHNQSATLPHIPRKSLGQNFLTGSHFPERIINAVSPQPNETIIEIGPGQGALTEKLIASGSRVMAIELDRNLIPVLNEKFSRHQNFQLIEADALTVNFREIIQPAARARVVANLPYNVATPILQRLIQSRSVMIEMTLMFQREVVERITAAPGGKEYGYLSVIAQFYCEVEKLFEVPPGAFRPVPKVMSSVVRLRVRNESVVSVIDETYFQEVVSVLFGQRRKTILNNLRSAIQRLHLNSAAHITAALTCLSIDPQRRAETLTIVEMAQIADELWKLR
jgi:16S rRNA (adenine1518-N6/adenine1519-N6)-dimethyltransferase